jgi:hypothetical protein
MMRFSAPRDPEGDRLWGMVLAGAEGRARRGGDSPAARETAQERQVGTHSRPSASRLVPGAGQAAHTGMAGPVPSTTNLSRLDLNRAKPVDVSCPPEPRRLR